MLVLRSQQYYQIFLVVGPHHASAPQSFLAMIEGQISDKIEQGLVRIYRTELFKQATITTTDDQDIQFVEGTLLAGHCEREFLRNRSSKERRYSEPRTYCFIQYEFVTDDARYITKEKEYVRENWYWQQSKGDRVAVFYLALDPQKSWTMGRKYRGWFELLYAIGLTLAEVIGIVTNIVVIIKKLRSE